MAVEGEWEEVAEEPEADEEGYEPETAPEAAYDEVEAPRIRHERAPVVRRPDKSVLAMVSGLGFFVVVLILGFGVWNLSASVPMGAPMYTGLVVVGLALAVAIPYLWMLDDLRVQPRGIKRAHARFMAGPLIGVLAVLFFVLFTLAAPAWLLIALAVAAVALMQASVALLLYSVLWVE